MLLGLLHTLEDVAISVPKNTSISGMELASMILLDLRRRSGDTGGGSI